MVSRLASSPETVGSAKRGPIPAAQYVRMSTEHQRYSTENQSDAILQFVSVTQQCNTTSSTGRLTLNVLLSFAQFEREVTGNASATRSPRRKRTACGWVATHRSAITRASARSLSTLPRPRPCATSSRYIFSSAACGGSRTRPTASGSKQSAAPQQMASSAAASRSRADTSTGCSRTRFTPVGLHTRVSSTPASIRRSSNMRLGPLFAARRKPGIKNGFFSGVEVKISLFSPRRQGIRRGSR